VGGAPLAGCGTVHCGQWSSVVTIESNGLVWRRRRRDECDEKDTRMPFSICTV